ncbi:HD-GYP domain-containing protein [Neobacillus sp. D3-1R]|uniref:HD-GYP domain-containing protein n=1 Tax=Neobacillus sp. D3-1R TaxID=3445778 RepID=UPI003FA0A70A
MRKYSYIGPIFAIILPFLFFELLKQGLLPDPVFEMPRGHFYIVSLVAILSIIIAISVGIVGNRLRNIKITFLSLSFISLALLFSVHGLSTPDFLLGDTHLPGVAAQLSIILATFWLWLSSLPTDKKIVKFLSRYNRLLLPVWICGLGVFAVSSLLSPHMVDIIPLTVNPLNWILMGFTILFNLVTMFQYSQSYRYSRFPLQVSIIYSSGWLLVSQLIMVLGEKWKLSWWTYHFVLLASMIVVLVGLIKQYAAKGSLVGALRALFTNDPFERVTGSISPSVRDLVIITEKKDTYTAGHTFRVTLYALKIAEELHLKPEYLRAIAQGTLLHDVGKVNIPDHVLNKPGKLTLEERMIIEKHPASGYEMCRDLGFMSEELNIIRHHHEKWDGSGYPDQLKGEEIPFLARIVAVADVYDALTSERSYRKAWTHEEAMNLIINQKESHFDPVCVDAWERLCERNPSVYQYPSAAINNQTTGSLISSF